MRPRLSRRSRRSHYTILQPVLGGCKRDIRRLGSLALFVHANALFCYFLFWGPDMSGDQGIDRWHCSLGFCHCNQDT
eukprot:4723230-Amphidinium_carterae.2